jgi:CheY-like chemotaxis protein
MNVNALLMCREQEALQMLVGALDELEIEEEICVSEPEAMELLAVGYYSAVVVDFDLPGAAQVARLARLLPAQRRPVVFAVINAVTDVGSAFQAGANFVLYKPLVRDQVMRSLRAGRAFMRPDRRRSPRQKAEALVYLRFGDVCPLPALVLEVSEEGLSVLASEPLPATELPLRFILPGTSQMIEGSGEVTWADDSGHAGIFFTQLTPVARRHLKAWMLRKDKRKASRGRVTTRATKGQTAAPPAS